MKIGFPKRENRETMSLIMSLITKFKNISHSRGACVSGMKGPPNAYTMIENRPIPRHSSVKSQNKEDNEKMPQASKGKEKIAPM